MMRLLIVCGLLVAVSLAQSWTSPPVTGASPGRLRDHVTALDRLRGELVLVGGAHPTGQTQIGPSGATWTWSNGGWTQRTDHPATVESSDMAWDPDGQRLILFGKVNAAAQTWAWDGSTWSHLPISGPSLRTGHAMALAEDRQVIVLFGGGPSGSSNNETWEFDCATGMWSQASPGASPCARSGHSMAWCANNQSVVMFGGLDGTGRIRGDTWTYDGVTWTRACGSPLTPTCPTSGSMTPTECAGSPANRRQHTMVSEPLNPCVPGSGRVFLWGGITDTQQGVLASPEVWAFGAQGWSALPNSNGAPSRRAHSWARTDAGTFLAFGGALSLAPGQCNFQNSACLLQDTWEFTPPIHPLGAMAPTYPGTDGDLALFSYVGPDLTNPNLQRGGAFDRPLVAGEPFIVLQLCSPRGGGALSLRPLQLLAEVIPTPMPAPAVGISSLIPWLHINVFGTGYLDLATTPFGPALYLPDATWSFDISTVSLPGQSVMVQALVYGPAGIVASEAHEFQF